MENLWWQIALGFLVGKVMFEVYKDIRGGLLRTFAKSETFKKIKACAENETGGTKKRSGAEPKGKIGFGER